MQKYGSVHHKNIQELATEMLKVKNALIPAISQNRFNDVPVESSENHYNLQKEGDFRRPLIKTVYNGSNKITYLDPKIWDVVPKN